MENTYYFLLILKKAANVVMKGFPKAANTVVMKVTCFRGFFFIRFAAAFGNPFR
jgi:hypothetical protein